MEAATSVAHTDHAHHPPEAHASSRIHRETLGMLLFIISELMLFGAFFTAYLFIRVINGGEWLPNGHELPVKIALVNSGILLSSSLTMHWALEGIKHGNRNALKAGLVATFLLGATFLTIQVNEYVHLGFLPNDSAQASVFFGLTGLHGGHVLIGLILLAVASVRSFRGHYSTEAHWGVEVPGIYWHFVDIMWIFVFTTLYIL